MVSEGSEYLTDSHVARTWRLQIKHHDYLQKTGEMIFSTAADQSADQGKTGGLSFPPGKEFSQPFPIPDHPDILIK